MASNSALPPAGSSERSPDARQSVGLSPEVPSDDRMILALVVLLLIVGLAAIVLVFLVLFAWT